MDIDEIRALYHQEQRIDVAYPGMRTERTPRVVRVIDAERGTIVCSWLDADNADETIRDEIVHFTALGIADQLEWKLYNYDQPDDLKERLIAHGFVPEEPPDAILVLDLAQLPDKLAQPVTHDVRRITDPAGVADMLAVMNAVWSDESHEWIGRVIATTLQDAPDATSLYIAYADGKPVSEGRLDFTGTLFAGLWGGATVPEYRNQGFYTALVAARAQEAIRRGVRFLTIDASPMSRAVLEKLGFRLMAYAWECNYRGA
jgi:GNAT superfamily N-acetyltransferase